jgi:sodium/proline symporter
MIMHSTEILAFFGYFILLGLVIFFSYKKQKSDTDFVIGNRSLNFWLTALSAHGSDMSQWLFMGYPALIFTTGIFNVWVAIGLTFFMFLNWQFIAPRIRMTTEKTESLTLNTYFEKRFQDHTGSLRIASTILTFLFYTFYISAGLVALGFLAESLFGLNYWVGVFSGFFIVVAYVFLGGYITVAWIDLFQGLFLLAVILFIPIYLLMELGGFTPIFYLMEQKKLSLSLFPSFSPKTFFEIFLIACGWGLGYFGQPHIITRFMGIKKVEDIKKAKYLGLSWQALTLVGATLFGLIGILIFPRGLYNSELISLEVVKRTLPPLFSGLISCAILAAATNVMAAQILVTASTIVEDLYKRLFHQTASHKELLWASRFSVLVIALVAFLVAFFQTSTIYDIVMYAWSGLGSSFGPLLLLSLYWEKITKQAAFVGMLSGGIAAAIWPLFPEIFGYKIPSMIIGFATSFLAIYLTTTFTCKTKKIENS